MTAAPSTRDQILAMRRDGGWSRYNIFSRVSVAARYEADIARRLHLWVADCAARVLPLFEAERPGDRRVRDAIVVTRAVARGEVGAADRAAASAAAMAAYWDAVSPAVWASAGAAVWAVDAGAAMAADAARTAVSAAGGAADTEREWQFDRLIARMSDPEPEDWPLDGERAQ